MHTPTRPYLYEPRMYIESEKKNEPNGTEIAS